MPWPKKQAQAILIKSRKRGDTKTARKAKASLRGKSKGGRKR